jgi:hypothetical protein
MKDFSNDTVIAKCGHEVNVIAHGTDSEEVPDCCSMCDELLERQEENDSLPR